MKRIIQSAALHDNESPEEEGYESRSEGNECESSSSDDYRHKLGGLVVDLNSNTVLALLKLLLNCRMQSLLFHTRQIPAGQGCANRHHCYYMRRQPEYVVDTSEF